jgi:hypothetical protein
VADFPAPHIYPLPEPLIHTDFAPNIALLARSPFVHSLPDDLSIYSRVVHPYNTSAIQDMLARYDLTARHPLLLRHLNQGFPLGNLPKLTHTVIIPNHSSVAEYPEPVQEYIENELSVGRISGPFSQKEVERILRGPFYASPLIVAKQEQGPDKSPKFRVCRNLSKDDPVSGIGSVNSFIDKTEFPTRLDMAFKVYELVSPKPHIYF